LSPARLAALSLLALAGCSTYQAGWPPPSFPPGNATAVLNIRDPLHLEGHVIVEARARGSDGREAPMLALMDSGASESLVPEIVARLLGLRQLTRTRGMVLGPKAAITAVVQLPELVLGDLVVRRVFVGTFPGLVGVVGQSVLRHAPWEISWDRGTITLGAAVWPTAAQVTALPLFRQQRFPLDEVEVLLNGRPFRILLDIGASVSAMPADVAATLGLTSAPYIGRTVVGMGGSFHVAHVFTGDLQLGPTVVAAQFLELPAGNQAVLGLDVLSRFNLLVLPGQRLFLKPRGDLRATARGRVGRWRSLPACASTGCVRARVTPIGRDGQLQLDIEGELPGSLRMIFGCAERGEERRLLVDMGGIKPGHLTTDVAMKGSGWFTPQGTGCQELTVLDVIPGNSASRQSSWLHAELDSES
jgi:predicted aspartyl protease